ncbi:P-loop ATPase, Sll1717 family [Bordetella genomosp. 11]|uniref:Uncharacterized protein n=1 Tax=Bordetella genomosp. 11 TaxID=1416808 RepID=A0A261UD49_9BORD|nr:hypothetical protein [Bordetella genomosp. 11]OZI59531.1 hypothetical protein CAL28_08335 [Bordetella genomosp. 11]
MGSFGVEESFQRTDEIEVIRHHLLQKESELKKAIGELRVGKNVALFMDGIDFRPESVPYIDYIECIKGLGEAAWHLNSDFFGNIRDSKGRLKIVLLLRPDVFHSMNIYNSNSRLRDNSVLLDWSTTEKEMRVSKLYSAAGRYFASQQGRHVDSVNPVEAADNYFSSQHDNTIFRRFLRTSFQKPRDVLTFIQTARQVSVLKLNKGDDSRLAPEVVTHPLFTKDYAVYLLGEVKNYAAFYMEQSDFATYLKFFQYLDGRSEFTYSQFCEAFRRFKKWINGEPLKATTYLRDAEALLQFFYDVNVIGYSEAMEDQKSDTRSPKATFYHWAYRERTLIDIAPKVKMSGLLRVNPGISKALDIGLHAQHPGSKEPERTRKARFARPGHRKANKQTDKRSGTAPSLQIQGGSKTDHKVALTNRDDGRKPYQDDRAATTTARQQQRHRQSNANGTKTQDSGRAPSSLGARARFKK